MAEKIPSPCISICQMDPIKNICIGCYRTRQEIARWPSMDGDAQRLLLDELGIGVQNKPGFRAGKDPDKLYVKALGPSGGLNKIRQRDAPRSK